MDVVDRFLAQCAQCTSETPTPALRDATGAFLQWVATQPEGAPVPVLEALRRLPPRGAAWLAITLGSAIESGAPLEASARAVTGLMRAWLEALPLASGERARDLDDAEHEIVVSMPYLCQSVVAHVARLPAFREELARETSLVARLGAAERLTHGAAWVHELLRRASGDLVVLHAESRRALALRYENVGSAFHLFTLLQGAIGTLLPGGRAPSASLLEAARGRARTEASDEAWWHYQDHTLPERSIARSIWAELSVRELPTLDGALVLVLWPTILGARHWGADFFGPAIEAAPPSVTLLRELAPDESARWLAKVGLPPR